MPEAAAAAGEVGSEVGIEVALDAARAEAPARRSLRAVVFDFGKTLATVHPSVEAFFGKHAERLGRTVEAADLRRHIRDAWPLVSADAYADEVRLERCWVALYHQVLHATGAAWDAAARGAAAMWQDHARADAYQLVEGALDTLRALRARDLTVAVLSNFDGSLDAKLHHLGVAPLVSHVFCSATVGLAKPDPRFLAHALQHLGLGADELIYVGDDPVCDRAPCDALGIDCLLVDDSVADGGGAATAATAATTTTIASLRQVLPHVERRLGCTEGVGRERGHARYRR